MRIKELSERYVFENENIPYIGILLNDSINELERAWNDRKFLIILNPHGGNGKAEEVYNGKTAIIIDLWNNCLSTIKEDPSFCDSSKDDVQVWSAYKQHMSSNHAEEMGRDYDHKQYEGVLFIRYRLTPLMNWNSGDGTVNEFLNGILSRSNSREILRNTLFGVIPAGSENSLARGMGTNNIYTSLYVLTTQSFHDHLVHLETRSSSIW